jgi:hypothetical protein
VEVPAAPYPCVVSTATQRSLAAPAGGLIGVSAVIGLLSLLSGASLSESIAISLALLWQGLGGVILWFRLRSGKLVKVDKVGLAELLGAGVTLGTAIAVIFSAAANSVISFTWWWAVPTALVLISSGKFWRDASGRIVVGGWSLWAPILSFIAVGFGALTINFRRYELTGANSDLFHPDMLFFEALARSTAQFGGSESAFLAGESIRYHWLVYAWAGELTTTLSLSPFVMLTRALPIFVLVASVVLVVGWSRTLSRQWWVPWIAAALLVTGGYFGAVNGTILNFDSPSQSLTALWLIALILLVTQWLRDRTRGGFFVGSVIFLLAFSLAAGKGSAGAVAVGSFAIGSAIAFVFLRKDSVGLKMAKRFGIAFALATLAFGLSYVLLLSGNASSGGLQFLTFDGHASTAQGLDSSPTNRGVILGTAGLLLAMSARFVGLLGWFTSREDRHSPEVLVGVGLVISGLVPVVIFSESINETWFALAVSAPLSVLSAVGLGKAVQAARISTPIRVLVAVAALPVFIAVSFVWTDQVWESGFGRFYAPWLGWILAALIGIVVAVFAGSRRFVSAIAAFVIVLTLGAAVSRFTPAVAAALGGPREGIGVGVADFADLPVRNSPAADGQIEVITDESAGESTAEPVIQPVPVSLGDLFYWDRFEVVWGAAEMEFAQQLQGIVPGTDLIATNDLYYPLVPALSERMTYLSATRYQELYGTDAGNLKIPDVKESVRLFFADPSALTAQPLCAASVKWLWLTSPNPAAYMEASGLSAELVAGENALISMPERFCNQ